MIDNKNSSCKHDSCILLCIQRKTQNQTWQETRSLIKYTHKIHQAMKNTLNHDRKTRLSHSCSYINETCTQKTNQALKLWGNMSMEMQEQIYNAKLGHDANRLTYMCNQAKHASGMKIFLKHSTPCNTVCSDCGKLSKNIRKEEYRSYWTARSNFIEITEVVFKLKIKQ